MTLEIFFLYRFNLFSLFENEKKSDKKSGDNNN